MKQRALLGLAAAWALATTLPAGPLTLGEPAPSEVRILSDEPCAAGGFRISLEARVGRLEATTRRVAEGEFTALEIPGFQQTETVGAPSLPVMNRLLEVPLGGEVSVQVASRSRRTIDLGAEGYRAPVWPRQPPRVKTNDPAPFAWDRRSYRASGFQQDSLARVEEVGMLRDMRLVLVRLAPVAYDPVRGVLEVHDEMRVDVRVRGADMAATAATKARYHSPYFSGLRRSLLTPPALRALDPAAAGKRTYAVVADTNLLEHVEPLLDLKRQQGFDVIVATMDQVGAANTAVTTYVHGLYNEPADGHGPPDFLLLVGDHDNLPAAQKGSNWSGHVSDLDFVAVTDDYLPDILSGRLSAKTTAELVPQVEKLVEYQRYEMADPSYLDRILLTAGWDSRFAEEWGYPQIQYGTQNYFNEDHGFTDVTVFLSEGAHQNESAIVSTVASGVAFYNYTAHGSEVSFADPKFTIADVESLGNEGQYPLVLANCCVTGSFDRDKCFGEAWLRAPGSGSIGFIGGSNNTYWDEDLWFGNGFYAIAHPNEGGVPPAKADTGVGAYDTAFENPYATVASLMMAGNLAVEASNTSRKLYYWEVYHLFGDPSLQVYWSVPEANPVQHPTRIESAEGGVAVQAAEGSYVGLTLDGEVLAASFVDAEGNAQLALDALPDADAVTLTVTAKNRVPFVAQIPVGPEDR